MCIQNCEKSHGLCKSGFSMPTTVLLFLLFSLFSLQEDNTSEGSFVDMIQEVVGLIWDNLLSQSNTCI
jgi:hypothetical protein